jgi:four helix bundle suffix protein
MDADHEKNGKNANDGNGMRPVNGASRRQVPRSQSGTPRSAPGAPSTSSVPPSHNSPPSHSSHPAAREPRAPLPKRRLTKPRGDYRTLLSYQKAEVIFDLTFRFAHRHLPRGDRTIDQMIQAARSGKQNILEGSRAGAISKETEIKLTGVARASLEEVLGDYQDYLRVRDHALWSKDSKEAQYIRRRGRKTPQTFELYREFCETRPPEVIANIAICLLHQTHYLLDQQLRRLEDDFLQQGGLRERMTEARLQQRRRQKPTTE